jgi:oligopeptidase A
MHKTWKISLMNSLLSETWLPSFAQFDPTLVPSAISTRLAEATACIDNLCVTGASTFDAIFGLLENLDDKLACAFSSVQHLHRVADSEALRAVYGPALDAITAHNTALLQNTALHGLMQALDPASLSPIEQRLRARWLRDFHLGGVALPAPEAQRFAAISMQLASLATEFEQALMDATDAWTLQLPDASRLAGLPADVIMRAQQRGEGKGYTFGLDYPTYSAIITYADDAALREMFYFAFATRASDQGPYAGKFDNSVRIERMLTLKQQASQLLGFANTAEESLYSKMAATPARVFGLLEDLLKKARPAAQAEIQTLAEFARSELGITELRPCDQAYCAEKWKARSLGLDDEMLRPYFPLPRVLDGLFSIIEKLFDVQIRQHDVSTSASTWHPDVRFFQIMRGAELVAGFYLDAYARPKKRGGAWMDVCRSRRLVAGKLRPPVAYLTCNFAPPTPQSDGSMQPALLQHDDVVTLFHEFGHGLHLMLTQVNLPGVGGIEGVEWDAVELPSQFMENFCWTDVGLDLLAQHWQTGAALPDTLRAQLHASKNFHAGLFLVRQLEFALFDFTLHQQNPAPDIQGVLALWRSIRARTAVLAAPSYHRLPHSFSHIFGGGYAAGYYSYLWAEVLSADVFSAFAADPLNPQMGQVFLREILSVGSSRPALASFVAFLGREPTVDALVQSYALA